MNSAGQPRARNGVVRHFVLALLLTSCWMPLQGATLERLSMDELVAQSTAIVWAKVGTSYGQLHGSAVYTHYGIQIRETYKGSVKGAIDIVVPGGTAGGIRQDVAGAPQLAADTEYVFFLWTGKSGVTHVMGLTQGLFALDKPGDADPGAVREASTELMLDRATGRVVRDERLTMRLSELKATVAAKLRGTAK
jgi:hypothetical protein